MAADISSLYQFIGYFSTRVRLDFSKKRRRKKQVRSVCVNKKNGNFRGVLYYIIITLFTIDLHETIYTQTKVTTYFSINLHRRKDIEG